MNESNEQRLAGSRGKRLGRRPDAQSENVVMKKKCVLGNLSIDFLYDNTVSKEFLLRWKHKEAATVLHLHLISNNKTGLCYVTIIPFLCKKKQWFLPLLLVVIVYCISMKMMCWYVYLLC